MFDRIFLAHPRSIGETYFEHLGAALSFSSSLMLASLACFVHAMVPCLLTRSASRRVTALHQRMTVNRSRLIARDIGAIDFAI